MRNLKAGVFIFVLVSVVFSAAGTGESEEKIHYKYKFKEGSRYYLKRVIEQKITRVVDSNEQITEQATGIGYELDVTEVDFEDNMWVSCKYDWTKVSLKSGEKTVFFDSSEKGTATVGTAGFKLIVGESFYVNITPEGEVKRVNGLDAVRSYVKNKIPPGSNREAVLKGLGQVLDVEITKKSFEDFMMIFPEKAVGVGDFWDRNVTFEAKSGKIIQKKKWTLKSRKDGISLIEFEGSTRPEALKRSQVPQNMKPRYEVSTVSRGQIEVEESTGRIIRSEIVEDTIAGYKDINGKLPKGYPKPVKVHSVTVNEMTEQPKAVPSDGGEFKN